MARHDFAPLEITGADAGFFSIALTLSDHSTHLCANDLRLVSSQPWPKEGKLNLDQALSKVAISPSGQWVISSGATWWDDCLFWNTVTNQVFLSNRTNANRLRFVDELHLVGANSTADNGINMDSITIDPTHPSDDGVSKVWLCNVPTDDMGSFTIEFSAESKSICMAGSWGYAAVNFGTTSDAFVEVVTQRYASLLGRNDLSPRPVAVAVDGSHFALACVDRLLIFDPASQPNNLYAKGHNAAMGATAMYSAEADNQSLFMRVTPSDPQQPEIRGRLARLPAATPGMRSIACGVAVSRDQRTVAVRFAEASRGIVTGEKTLNHKVVIYSGLDPVTGRPGNVQPLEIRLLTQDDNADNAAHEYRNERILELSPDGKYLLVGTRVTFESALAELYRTSDGQLIHYWPAGQLGGLVTSLGNSDYFADTTVSADAVRLISWKTGAVEREIKMPGSVTALCGAANGQEMLVSLDDKKIARYSATGDLLGSFDGNLRPIDASTDGKVFIGYLPETTTNGSFVLADATTGQTIAILSRGSRRFTPAQFGSDGQSFILATTQTGSEMVRNLTPAAADRILDPDGTSPENFVPGPPTVDLPPIKISPVMPQEANAVDTETADANDLSAMTADIGKKVLAQGISASTSLTAARNALQINFGERRNSFMIYIPPAVFPQVNAKFGGAALTALNQKHIRVTGTIVIFSGLPEIILDDPAHIDLADAPPTTSP